MYGTFFLISFLGQKFFTELFLILNLEQSLDVESDLDEVISAQPPWAATGLRAATVIYQPSEASRASSLKRHSRGPTLQET